MITFDEDETTGWRMGRIIAIPDDFATLCEKNIYVRICDRHQKFLGVSEVIETGLQPIVVLYPIN
jgi:hypothetical protein